MPKMGKLLRDGTVSDPFFESVHDGEWNACIGKQGDEINYVVGYLEAAQLLADTLVAKELYGSRDTLAMPILYNTRHSFELALKYILRELVAMEMARKREGAINHNLRGYWEHLSTQHIGDLAFRDGLAELKPFIVSFARQDIDGQELRYFENQEGKQSLDQLAVVNLLIVQAGIAELRDILERLLDRIFCLSHDVVAGTHTRECSRADLIAIAKAVGSKSTWCKDDFTRNKAAVMNRFGLTSNGFSKALTAIKSSRELGVLIDLDAPLSYLTAEKILEIGQMWLKCHPPSTPHRKSKVINAEEIGFNEIMQYGEDIGELNAEALERLSLEEFADMQTIFYIGRDRLFGEQYENALEKTLANHNRETNRTRLVHHILSKTNFVDGLVAGLKKVGQPKIAFKLADLKEGAHQ